LVQRPFDIDFLPPEERARGYEHVQERISGEIDQLADRLGMSPQEYIQVIQRLATPGQTIELSRLKDHQTALAILKNQFPTIMADFKGREMNPDRTRTLLGLAAKAEPEECLFWDRLYSDFRNLGSDPAAALDMILHNSGRRFQKPEGPPPELAGRLTPLPEFENLSLAGFTRVMTPYFRANIRAYAAWPSFSKENEPDLLTAYAKELAQNMFVASEAFGVPRTLMVSIAHQETYFANVMGDGHQSASPFQIYAPTKPYIIKAMWAKGLKVPKVPERLQEHLALSTYMAAFFMSELMDRSTTSWSSGRPGLCDLDRVALHYNGGEHYPPAVVGKKMRLVQYLERVRDVARQKKDRPRA
jgi:hypothetical protein